MWTVKQKEGYPSSDKDICWEYDMDYFSTKKEAEQWIKSTLKYFAEEKPNLYAWEISEEVIEQKQYQHALWQANMI